MFIYLLYVMLLRVCSVAAHKHLGQVSVSVCVCAGHPQIGNINIVNMFNSRLSRGVRRCNSQPKRTLLQHKPEKSALKGRRRKKSDYLAPYASHVLFVSAHTHTQSPDQSRLVGLAPLRDTFTNIMS